MPDRVPAEEASFPRRFGRYTLLGRLGRGGMSEVFLADQPASTFGPACRVVIKQLKERLASGVDFAQMSADEARISSALVHRNIVRVHDFGRVGDTLYLAMEYVPGRTLEQLLRDVGGPLPPSLGCHLLAEVCSGLGHAHGKTNFQGEPLQIVHRDVNPPNVLIADDGRVMITDFGIATAAHRSYQTVAGVIKGKYHYMAPEQAAGMPVDRRTDLFCLGIVLYQVLTGVLPFQGKTPNEILRKVVECKPLPPSLANPRLPGELEAVVMQALSKDPAARFQEAAEMERQLRDFARQSTNPGSRDIALFARGASMQGGFVQAEVEVSVQDAPAAERTEGRADPAPKEGDPVTTLGMGSATQAAGGGQTVIRQRPVVAAEGARSKRGLYAASAGILATAVAAGFWGASSGSRQAPVSAASPAALQSEAVAVQPAATSAGAVSRPAESVAVVAVPTPGQPAAHSSRRSTTAAAAPQPSLPLADPLNPTQARDALDAIPTIAVPTATPTHTPRPGKGGLTVLVDDWGEVSIDGEPASQTAPFTDLPVPAGLHRVSVRTASGVRDFDVNIGRGKTTTIDAAFR